MSFKKLLILFILSSVSINIYSQVLTQTIRGTVLDSESEFPLIGVTIILVGSDPILGTVTDYDGYFRLENVPIGRQSIEVSYIGYETTTRSNLVVSSARELSVDIFLKESLIELEEVVISAKSLKNETINSMSPVSARTFSVEEAGRYSGTINDPARMAQNYAGVSGASDQRNDIIIRGNSPLGVLWRMEGIDIPSPNHFAALGTTGGPVSMLNINNLSNSDFMTSAWSAEYGNAISGVFDLKLRNGNKDTREYKGQIGFNGFELGAEGPFKKGKRPSYIANFRYSTLEVMNKLGFNIGTGGAVPQYKDLVYKINIPTKKAGNFSFWGMGGLSFIHFVDDPTDSTNIFGGYAEDLKFSSNTGIVGASHTFFFNDYTYSKLSLVASSIQTTTKVDSISTFDESHIQTVGFNDKQSKLTANLKLNSKINSKNTISGGIMFDYYDVDILDTTINYTTANPIAEFEGGTSLVQAYFQMKHRFSDIFDISIGVRDQYFYFSKSNDFEGRLGLKYNLNDKNTLSFGTGMHSQIQPIVLYFAKSHGDIFPNDNLGFTKSIHTVLGYDYFIGQNWRIKSEVYYQWLYNIPVDSEASAFSMLNSGADFIYPLISGLKNEGSGKNYGIELTVEKFFSRGYYFLTTFSLFDSKYKGSDKIERNTYFNSNYVLNVLGGKEFVFGGNKTLSFDSKFTYYGGRRYTPIDLVASKIANRAIFEEDKSYSLQYSPYAKLDFKISFKLNSKRISQVWSVDLLNLTNHQNVFSKEYSVTKGDILTRYQRGFFPNIQYSIDF